MKPLGILALFESLDILISRDSSVNIVSLFIFSVIFHFLRTLPINLISDERYMYCSIKVQINRPRKYIAYSIPPHYLNFIRSEIQGMKSRDSSINVASVFFFTIILCYHIKTFLIISSFLKIYNAIVSNSYQNLDDTLIRECTESVLQYLHSRLIYQRSQLW